MTRHPHNVQFTRLSHILAATETTVFITWLSTISWCDLLVHTERQPYIMFSWLCMNAWLTTHSPCRLQLSAMKKGHRKCLVFETGYFIILDTLLTKVNIHFEQSCLSDTEKLPQNVFTEYIIRTSMWILSYLVSPCQCYNWTVSPTQCLLLIYHTTPVHTTQRGGANSDWVFLSLYELLLRL